MKNLLVSICLIVTFVIGCASPSSSASSTVTHRVPAILGHGPLSTARSLNADWGNSTVMNGMGMVVSAAPAIAITPLITGWTASSGNAVTGETLTYEVYGNLLTVVATVNVDNSVTYTGTFTNNTTVGPATAQPTNPTITVVQDGNDSSLLATLDPTGTTFSYTQKLYVNFWNPQSMTSDYQLAYQVYSNASGSGTITFEGYVASGTETFVGNSYTHTSTSSSAPPILASDSSISGAFVVADWTTSVQKVAFSIKSDAYNLALLLNQNFLTVLRQRQSHQPLTTAILVFPCQPAQTQPATRWSFGK